MTTNVPPHIAQQIAQTLMQADRLQQAGRAGEAEQLCRNLLTSHPQSCEALNFLALLVRDRGDLDEAETLLRRAIKVLPRESALHNNLGNLLRRKGDLTGSESAYRSAIALKRDYPEAYYNLGIVLRELGRGDQALAAQRHAVSLRPNYTDALAQMGALLDGRGEHDEALRVLDAVLVAKPNHFDAVYYRGVVLSALERYDDAIASFERAVALRPNSHESQYALGNSLVRANREEQALEAYRKAIELAPEFLAGHYAFNSLAWTLGREDLNFTSYASARSRVGDKPDLLLAEAEQRLRLKDAPAAEHLLRRAHDAAPERMDVANSLARALGQLGRNGESIALLQSAVAAEPALTHHRRDLGVALLQHGEPAQARQVLEEALKLAPSDQLILAFLTLAYREAGDSRLATLFDAAKYVRAYDLSPPPGFADGAQFNQALGEELLRLHTRRVEPFDQTLRGGTQTEGHLFARHARPIEALRERIAEIVTNYIRDLPDDPTHPFLARKAEEFSFVGSWSCRLRSSGFHTNHVHPEGWISSAYYVSLPDAIADGKQGWLTFGESNLGLGERDRPDRFEKPAIGKLVLFPSHFWHGTVPFVSDAMRLTVAFDVVPGKIAVPRDGSSGY
jgi:tetratricopeptide (TPR) repeat protein